MKTLYKYSRENFNQLPWRIGRDNSCYPTLVSEIMLQQTTVSTVLNHYPRFMKQFPDIRSLAETTEEELTIAWKGLGYYRRAKNLHQAAKFIIENHKGKIPREVNELIEIPGIGDYTANALRAIGRDLPSLAIDANIERVLARFYGLKLPKGTKLHKELKEIFTSGRLEKDFKIKSYRDFHEAIMDVGRTYCQTRKFDCNICPLQKKCIARVQGSPLEIPIVGKKNAKYFDLKLLRIIVHGSKNNEDKDEAFFYKKDENSWLAGQYELPTFILESEDSKLSQYPLLPTKLKERLKWSKVPLKTSITKYKIQNFICEFNDYEKIKRHFPNSKRLRISESQNFSTATLKVLRSKKLL